jgi:hypothetical protein
MSPIFNFATMSGVPENTVTLLLMLPVVVTLIAFFRQVVGIKAFGIYTPAIITFAFLATNQLRYGILIFVTVIIVGTLTRFLIKSFRLLYLPRIAIVLTVVTLAIFALLIVGGVMNRTGLASVSIFPILIMITLVEKFIATQVEKGGWTAVALSFETLFISIACYYVASWPFLQYTLLKYPWLVILTIVINILLGKWTGLRLTEYFRFRQIINRDV